MMRSKFYSATTGFLFLFLFLCRTGEIRAEGRNMVAEFLCDRAQTFYEQGEKKEALQEFSKALLIDPGNPTAHEYLARLGVPDGLYRPLKTVSIHRRDREGQDTSIMSEQKTALPTPGEALEEKSSKDQDDLKQLIKARDEDITRLKEELALARKNTLSLPKNASIKTSSPTAAEDLSPESSDLKSQIRNVQLELTETQMSLKEKDKTLTELKKQLDEITQRNNLSQKIIQEKDSQIKKLVEDMQSPH